MTAIMLAATAVGAAADIGEQYKILAGEDTGATVQGYSKGVPQGDFGELVEPSGPENPKTFFGQFLIMAIVTVDAFDRLVVTFEGHVGQNSFRGIDVRPAVGGVFFTADADFFLQPTLPDRTQWGWENTGLIRDNNEYEVSIVG